MEEKRLRFLASYHCHEVYTSLSQSSPHYCHYCPCYSHYPHSSVHHSSQQCHYFPPVDNLVNCDAKETMHGPWIMEREVIRAKFRCDATLSQNSKIRPASKQV
ncbi:hypothetical protein Fot_42090 [Forsythia ovata]|uniref:Uncharacterized protein n=1 Tax=Forsythia ovata TaxID=205694 RepID=A0ABD1RLY8_9LAMI